ncbi:MAG: acyltransferase [Phycisphaerae bacterium]
MRRAIKTLAECIAAVMLLPFWIYYLLERVIFGRTRACQAISQAVSYLPGWWGELFRRVLLRAVLARVGRDVVISFGTVVSKPAAELADGVYVGSFCMLGDVRIGAETLIADHVCIPSGSGQHGIDRLDVPIRQQEGQFRTVHIGADCWIGSGAVILADVGDHCVVAAGSVVTKPVEDYLIVAGNPAKALADRRERTDVPSGRGEEPAQVCDLPKADPDR